MHKLDALLLDVGKRRPVQVVYQMGWHAEHPAHFRHRKFSAFQRLRFLHVPLKRLRFRAFFQEQPFVLVLNSRILFREGLHKSRVGRIRKLPRMLDEAARIGSGLEAALRVSVERHRQPQHVRRDCYRTDGIGRRRKQKRWRIHKIAIVQGLCDAVLEAHNDIWLPGCGIDMHAAHRAGRNVPQRRYIAACVALDARERPAREHQVGYVHVPETVCRGIRIWQRVQ